MPSSSFMAMIDTGNPILNLSVNVLLMIGAVAVTRSVAEDVFHMLKRGSIKFSDLEHSLKKLCKEGVYWGCIAALYVMMEYGASRISGSTDWKNAMIGGALTGAIVSAVGNQSNVDKIAIDAITGGAIATASVFINYLT